MMVHRILRTASLCAVLFAWGVALAQAAGMLATPDAATKAFYRLYARAHVMDIPSAKQQAIWRPVLSDHLMALIVLGDEGEKRWAEKNKKEPAPPLFEGDLFSSMTEGGAKLDGATCEASGDNAVCTAALHVVGKNRDGERETFRWHDKLDLIRTPAGWRVDDLEYGGTGDFGPKGKLSDQLKYVDQESRKSE